MRKWLGIALAGLVALAWTGTAKATNYALCTGLNEYSDPGNDLDGCVPDAKNVYTNIILRGEWKSANATLLTNSQGTFAAVSNKLMSFASSAVSGDVVLYYQSSHGYQSSGKNTGICMYDKNMSDSNFAKILANFKSGVKVVIVLDTCHSGGMFKSARRDGTAELSSPFAFAQRVNEELAAIRADEAARGIRTAAKLAVLDCAWITAADYDQYSWDGDDGGKFTVCFVGSVKSGACDKSPYGNGDSYATFQEMFDYAVAQDITHGNGKPGTDDYTMPQCTNTTVLAAVTFGWVGDEEPSGVRFAPIPDQTATVGAPLAYTLVASNADGSTGAITFSIASSTAPSGSYSLSGANFTFTPPTDGAFTFDFLATNKTAKTSGKASMSVSASLAAPTGLANSGITASSFTASWNATAGATSYLLDVATTAFGAKAAGDDVLLNEDFSGFTGTAADRSTDLDTYLAGTGWTGSKVFENAASAKLGSGNYNGWIATPELDLSSGGTVSFLLTQYGSDANTVTVSIISGDQEDEIGTATPGSAETVEFAIPAASEATSVKIETSAKRAIIDDLVVSGGSAADVLANQSVSGTSFTVEGLNTDTYYWHVRAVGNAKGPFSETMEVTLQSDPSAPPTIRAIDDIAIDVGETATFEVKVSAPEEAPVTSLEITDGDASATLVDSVFSFTPAAPGTYDFTVTAVNANDSTSESFAVIASLAEPETPEASSVGSDGFTATWAAIPGAASYELDVIQGATSGGGSGGGGSGGEAGEVVLTEDFSKVTTSNSIVISDFDAATQTSGWSGSIVYPAKGFVRLGKSGEAGYLQTPALSVSGSVTVKWSAYSWPNDATEVLVGVSENGGSSFTETSVAITESLAEYTTTFPVSASSVVIRWQGSSKSTKQRFYLDDITISSGSKARDLEGTHVEGFPKNVGDVTSYAVTGLQPLTEYTFAVRAVAAGETTEWSAPQTVQTSEGPSAPAWSAIPAQHTYAGFTFQLDLSGYLSGSPTPTVTADVGSVTGLNYVYEPDQTGTVTVTLTAVNDSGTLATTFTIAVDEPPVGGNHYAVIVGCNKYDTDYIPSSNFLNGCVPDANHVQALVTSRGLWEAANVTKLTDSAAKHASILSAIAAAASNAIPGDTFLYFHSSHGGNYNTSFVTNTALYSDWPILVYSVDPEGVDNCICSYDADFTAAELASALAAFDPAVNIVVMIDACHSSGMFVYNGTPVSQRTVRRNAAGKALRAADPALFAEAVSGQVGAIRRARGIRSASNIAFVTAANFDEYSYDSQDGDGGEFTTAFIDGVTNGLCDGADYGDQDGWATFYEGWNYAKDIATGIPEGTEIDDDGHTVDAHGYGLYDNTYYAQYYDEPEYYYDYYFTHPQIDNEALLRVIRVGYAGNPTLDAPVAAEASGVTASSFTASWTAVDGATGYHLQVATDPAFSTGAASDTIVVGDLAATGTTYTDFSDLTKDSGAVYAGTSAKSSSGAIQLNDKKDAGIWTTASGGNVSRVAVVWNDATSSGRTIKVYGSDSPLTSYSAVTAATSLGNIVYGTSSELAIEGSYPYVGFVTSGGALYLDSITFDWGTAGSESSIVFDQDVGNVTSHEVTGLDADTDYWYRVQALGDPVNSDFSNVIALTTEGGTPAAPVWSDIPAQTVVAGEDLVVDLKPYVTGSPKPTITADAGTVENGVLTVSFAEAGSFTVNLTAENTEGSAPGTLAVTVTAAPVTVPTLALSNPTSEGFDAAWDACDGVTSYTLEVSKAEFRAARDGSTILSEDFASCDGSDTTGSDITSKLDNFTSMDGWSGSKVFEGVGKLKLGTGSANGWVATPALDIPAGAVLTCKIAKYGSDTGQVAINLIADGATNVLKEAFSPVSGGETVTVNFTQACTGAKVQFISSAKRFYLDDVVIMGEGGGGDDVLSFTVEGLFKTVTGLEPETLYYARVKGASDWSEVQSITTLSDEPASPVWLELPAQTATVGLEFGIDLSPYVTGNPFPAIFVDGQETDGGAWVYTFDEAKTNTYALLASNSLGTAEATLTVVVSEAPPAKYAVCVGLSEYDMAAYEAQGLAITPLEGCVNDATYMKKNLTERGGWAETDVALLPNGSATKDAIRGAIAAVAAKAKAGDTFVYQHSSHGIAGDEDDDYVAAICSYNALYTDYELAEDLSAFPAGVKVVIAIDTCHSAGMIRKGGKPRAAAADIARRVSALMDTHRAARKARGEDTDGSLSSDEIGWVTAAALGESSQDGGYYDTDEWLGDDDAKGETIGGVFLSSFTWGGWSGEADVSGTGDGDGWFDAYEGWGFASPVCAEHGFHPQYYHEDVLRSVELGWIGKAEPSADILFDAVPGVTVGIGEEAVLDGIVARNADGTTDGIVLSIASTDPEDLEYTFADGKLTFTPEEDGLFLFTVQAANGEATATKLLGITATLPAPVALAATDVADTSFTANWEGVATAQGYQLQVSTDPAFPSSQPDVIINEGFDGVTNKIESLPEGWAFEGKKFDIYNTGGEAAPSIKLSTDGDKLVTPTFKMANAQNGIAFWVKGNPGGTNAMTSTVTLEVLVDGEWQTFGEPFVPTTDSKGEKKEYEKIPIAATQARIVLAKLVGNVAIDDVCVATAPADAALVLDEEEIAPEATSYAVKNLTPGTTYHYRVRAIGSNTRSAWSGTIEVTTTGEAPLPVPVLILANPEQDSDTSIAAAWLCAGEPESFRLQIATDGGFADGALVYDEVLSGNAAIVTGLTPGTTYYGRVCVVGGGWSDVAEVTTTGGDVPPTERPEITKMTFDSENGGINLEFKGPATEVWGANKLTAADGSEDGWKKVQDISGGSPVTVPMGTPFLRVQ